MGRPVHRAMVYIALTRARGAIFNSASMLSLFGGPLGPAYSAFGCGGAQLTKALEEKWSTHDIRVNAIALGWIETEMTDALRPDPARITRCCFPRRSAAEANRVRRAHWLSPRTLTIWPLIFRSTV